MEVIVLKNDLHRPTVPTKLVGLYYYVTRHKILFSNLQPLCVTS